MKFVISLILIILFSITNVANSNEFYIKALKEAALSNGFQKPEDINSLFDKEKSELGNKLFHDELLSLNSTTSCSSCHLTKFSSADGLPNAIGTGGEGDGLKRVMQGGNIVPRNTLPLWGRGSKNFDTFFWDGKVTTVDGKVISQLGLLDRNYATREGKYNINVKDNALLTAVHLPFVEIRELVQDDEEIQNYLKKEEIGAAFDIFEELAERIKTKPEYADTFSKAYQIDIEEISFHHIADSITHFIKDEFAIKDTKFSNFIFNEKKLTTSEIKGGLIFYGKGNCAACHSGPLFSDLNFHSIPFPQIGFGKNGFGVDYGKFNITFNPDDLYKFRTPPLYNVENTFPYSHSGSVYDLKESIIYHFDPLRKYNPEEYSEIDRNEYYKKLTASGNEMELIPYLDDKELDNLVDFLKTLSFPGKNQKLTKAD
jgi:cytochrome c peroxidase